MPLTINPEFFFRVNRTKFLVPRTVACAGVRPNTEARRIVPARTLNRRSRPEPPYRSLSGPTVRRAPPSRPIPSQAMAWLNADQPTTPPSGRSKLPRPPKRSSAGGATVTESLLTPVQSRSVKPTARAAGGAVAGTPSSHGSSPTTLAWSSSQRRVACWSP